MGDQTPSAAHAAAGGAPSAEDAAEAADDESPVQYVTLANLVAGDGKVALTDTFDVAGSQLAGVCLGDAFILAPVTAADFGFGPEQVHTAARELQLAAEAAGVNDIAATLQRHGLTEYRLAKALGIEPVRLAQLSYRLWGGAFTEERDRLAGADANAQKRGRVTRELRTELEKAIADGNDQ